MEDRSRDAGKALASARSEPSGGGAGGGVGRPGVPQPSALLTTASLPHVTHGARQASLLDAGVVKIRVPKLLRDGVRAVVGGGRAP
jgi:hypothetical protein